MSNDSIPAGAIAWSDITVADAEGLRDFYSAVTGWRTEPVAMDGYDDFNMISPETGEPVAGVCHARGENAGLPAQWLIYITVPDVAARVRRALELGGSVVAGDPEVSDDGGYCVLRDPAGAVFALYQTAKA
jgi:predicted enzyme related to lactoylglutathione lyase